MKIFRWKVLEGQQLPLVEGGIACGLGLLVLIPLICLVVNFLNEDATSVLRCGLWLCCLVSIGLAGGLFWGVFRPLQILLRELQREEPASDAGRARRKQSVLHLVAPLLRRARALRDKAERSRLALEESHETMRHTEKLALVGKLAAGVAHSIRNPLTGVKLRLFSLTRGMELTEKQQADVQGMNEALRHMESITTNFLEFSRRPRLSKEPLSITAILDRTLSLLAPRLGAYQVNLIRQQDGMLPLVDADSEQLCEAFANLLINACEAAGHEGEVRISEEKGRLAPLGSVVVVRIEDSGPGIPADLQDIIFQPFISTKEEGTGLGLPIARRIFEEHGGWLHLHSAPGHGACFVAVLPARKDDDIWLRSS